MTGAWQHSEPAGRYHAALQPPRTERREQARRDAAAMLASMRAAGGALRPSGRLDAFDARVMNGLARIAGEACPYPGVR